MELITDIEAEHRVLSSMLHSEKSCLEAMVRTSNEDYSDHTARQIFTLASSICKRGTKPSYIEVLKEGSGLGLFKDREGYEQLKYIVEQYIDDENISYWIDKVIRASKGRKAQTLLRKYNHELEGQNVDIDGFIQRAGSDFMGLAMNAETEKIKTGADVATPAKQQIAANVENWRKAQNDAKSPGDEMPLEGVTTGLKKLNNRTLGYKPGDLIILGAQTGHGKTAFALNTVNAACIENNQRLLYVNTEMSEKQIAYRLGSIISQIQLQKIRSGSLSNGELEQLNTCYEILAYSAFTTCTIPNLTPGKLQTIAQKAKLQFDTQMLILDYVGRMEKRDPKFQEWQVLEDIVKACKIMAQNLEIACMVLVQLNEDGSLQGAKRMKNECDLMLQLLPLGDEEDIDERRAKFEKKYGRTFEPGFNYYLRIDKSRDSEAGISIPLVFDKARQQIREAREASKTGAWTDMGRVIEGGEK